MGPHAPAARLGGAALGEGTLLELGDAVADVECVGHDEMTMACEMRWLAVVLGEAPGKAAVLGAVARGVLAWKGLEKKLRPSKS